MIEDGQPRLVQASESARSLVAYLLLHRESAHPRQQLAYRLWPESGDAQAQSNLRVLLVRLRKAWPGFDRYVAIDQRLIGWRRQADVLLDVAEFEAVLHDNDNRVAALERAVELYRGDLFPACYADWIVPERDRLRQCLLKALDELVDALAAAGNSNQAIGFAQRRLQADPLDEAAHQAIMRLHARRGDRAGVVRAYETCAQVLRSELSVEPGLETTALYRRLLEQPLTASTPAPGPAAPPHNLTRPLTRFIGRTRERREVAELLRATRLLTLTGAGGCGKTRLAGEAAFDWLADHPDGAWWVDLAVVSDPAHLETAVASALGVLESGDADPLMSAIGARRLLLILDNCEHIVDACADLSTRLLSACPQLTILATSREALGIAGEAVYTVAPLPVPATDDEVLATESAQLFIDRAMLARPTFVLSPGHREAVARICRRLDGIPLAIELAAARVKAMSVDQIADRLAEHLGWLVGPARAGQARHQTLQALVDWSHALLSEPERIFFRRLAVFVGGFSLEAAEAWADDDAGLALLARLIDRSLVMTDERPGQSMRYRLLEPLRVYAFEKLETAGESAAIADLHAAYFARLAGEADRHSQGPRQAEWVERLARDADNLRAALNRLIEQRQSDRALRMCADLGWLWVYNSELAEGRRWLSRVLALPDVARYPADLARAWTFMGVLAFLQTETLEARPWLERALGWAREHDEPLTAALALDFLALILLREHDVTGARAGLEASQALFARAGGDVGQAITVWHLGYVAEQENDMARAVALFESAREQFRSWGDVLRQCAILRSLGWNYCQLGDRVQGLAALRDSLTLARAIHNKVNVAHTLRAMAERAHDPACAVRLLSAALVVYENLGAVTFASALRDTDLAARRTELDQTTYQRASEQGRALTLDQAIDEALRLT